jgi:hypothetical protein
MSRFVRPDTTTLKITQGDTLVVKRRLNAGEQRAAFARMATAGVDGELRVNSMNVGLSLIVAYLVDWSLVNDDGDIVPIRDQGPDVVAAALDELDPVSFAEIREAIEQHDVNVRKERDQEKNAQDGAIGSSAISPSPDAVTGAMSGSVN